MASAQDVVMTTYTTRRMMTSLNKIVHLAKFLNHLNNRVCSDILYRQLMAEPQCGTHVSLLSGNSVSGQKGERVCMLVISHADEDGPDKLEGQTEQQRIAPHENASRRPRRKFDGVIPQKTSKCSCPNRDKATQVEHEA